MGRRTFTIVCLLVIVGGVISVTVALTARGGGANTPTSGGGANTPTSSGGSAKYSAHVVSYTAINRADLSVAIRVTNAGMKPGMPTCTINARDPSGTYTGTDAATLPVTVGPGGSATVVDNLTISKHGASHVTQVTVRC